MIDMDEFDQWCRDRQERRQQRLPVGVSIAVPVEPGFYVYEHRGSRGEVLYVGRTARPAMRVANHVLGRRSHWWPDVHSIVWHRVVDADSMEELERRLIDELLPLHNQRNKRLRLLIEGARWRVRHSRLKHRDLVGVAPVSPADAQRWLADARFVIALDACERAAS